MNDSYSANDSIQELYQQIESQKPNKSSYSVAPTCLYLSKDYSFSKAKRSYLEDLSNKYPEVDPCKYSDTLESSITKYWLNPTGTFPKSKKNSYLSKTLSHSESLPGPSDYQTQVIEKKVAHLGKFSKAARLSFLSDFEAVSQQVPSSFKYYPSDLTVKNFQNSIYHRPHFKPPLVKKESIGPGSYDADKSISKLVLRKTIVLPVSKSKDNHASTLANIKQRAPPIGAYPASEEFLAMVNRLKKKKSVITNYKFKRFSESMSIVKAWVPGPGSYNIGPLPKIERNQEEMRRKMRALRKKAMKEGSKSSSKLGKIDE